MVVAVIIAFVSFLSIVLGVIALKSKNRVRLSFSVFSFCVAAWVLVNFIFQITGERGLVKSFYALGALAICSGLIFTISFLFDRIHVAAIAVLLLLGLVNFYLSLFTDLVIRRVDQVYATGYKAETGGYFLFYSLFIVAGVLAFFVVSVYQRKRSEGVKRNQIGWIMAGFGMFGLVTAIVSFVLPLFGVWTLTSFGSPSAIFFVLASFYAITRYRLLDLRIVIRKSFLYFMLAIFVFIVYYINVYFDEHVFGGQYSIGAFLSAIIIAPLFLLGFTFVNRLLQRFANKYFFTGLYDPQETIKEFSSKISQTIRLDGVARIIIDTIQNSLRADNVAVALRNRSKNYSFRLFQSKGFTDSNLQSINDSHLILEFSQNTRRPAIIDELLATPESPEESARAEAFTFAKNNGVEIILPLVLKDKINSIVMIGKKATREAYTKEDIDFLSTLSNQAVVAIENARLYNSMQEIVEEQTREIKEKNLHLQELLKMKSEFLQIASHQLRTPLSAIRGLLSMQAEGDFEKLPKEQVKIQQQNMLESASRLSNIVNDLLDAMELEGGYLNFKYEKVDPLEMMEAIIQELKPNYDKKGLYLKMEKPRKPLPKIEAEPKYLREALENFVDNAEKYINKGGTTIDLSQKNNHLHIKITDTGIGIPKSDMPKLFHKFSRGEKSTFQHTDGSGLGLFIAKNIIDEHHGKISIESPGEGKGTTVSVTLPISQAGLNKIKNINE